MQNFYFHAHSYEILRRWSIFIRNVGTFFQGYTAFEPKNEITEIRKLWFCKFWKFYFFTPEV
jgi:hypothetical protein